MVDYLLPRRSDARPMVEAHPVDRNTRRQPRNQSSLGRCAPIEAAQRGQFLTGAKIDTTINVLRVKKADLLERLKPFGLEVEAFAGLPSDEHPVVIETFNSRDSWGAGRDLLGNTWTNHDLCRRTGAVAGALGWGTLGLLGGPLVSMWCGVVGAKVGGKFAEATSQAVTQRVGNPSEVMVWVPNAKRAGQPEGEGRLYLAMPGMYTNKLVADLGEQLVGYGMHKEGAKVSGDLSGFQVVDEGREVLRTRYIAGPRGPGLAALEADVVDQQVLEALRTQPILGHLSGQSFAISMLQRFLETDPNRCSSSVVRRRLSPLRAGMAEATLEVGPSFMKGLQPGVRRAHSLQIIGLETALTWPTKLPYGAL